MMLKKFNDNLAKLVFLLNDHAYHDGDSLGKQLGMSRAAIWKMIKKLIQYDIQIESVKGKGYILREPLILLDPAKINISKKRDDHPIEILESVSSTNDYLKKLKISQNIKICLAEHQSGGRGRLQRQWYSPFGRNIYLSCLYSFQKDISELAGLSLVTSLAILKALRNWIADEKLAVKWPNDIFFENKKLSGSLIEIQAETHGVSQVIIGIGLNVNMGNVQHHLEQFSTQSITKPWTHLQAIVGGYINRNELASMLIKSVLSYLQKFKVEGFNGFKQEWIANDCLTGKNIVLKNLNQEISGKVLGVNQQGQLVLQMDNQTIQTFSSGDTTIVSRV